MKSQETITFSNDCASVTQRDIQDAALLAESYFHTEKDPTQLKANESNFSWIFYNFPHCMNIIKEGGHVVGLTFILPCTQVYRNKFLSGKMNEAELFDKIRNHVNFDNFETIYLCLAFLKPEYRGKELALKGFLDSVKSLQARRSDLDLFYWAYSPEGAKLAKKVAAAADLVAFVRRAT